MSIYIKFCSVNKNLDEFLGIFLLYKNEIINIIKLFKLLK